MKKYTLSLFVFTLVLSLFNSNSGSAIAYYDSGCTKAGPYSVTTGRLCRPISSGQVLGASAILGDIVIYASDVPNGSLVGAWSKVSDAASADSTKLKNRNDGDVKISPALANPADYFEVTFNANAGTLYHIWLHLEAESNHYNNDSVNVQFSPDSLDTNGTSAYRIGTTSSLEIVLEEGNGAGVQGWGWNDNSWGNLGTNFSFASSGTKTLRIQQREDGVSIDQIIISPSTYLSVAPGALKNDTTIVAKPGVPPPPPPPSDTVPPTISISAPLSGATVSGSSVTVSANASDNVGVAGVQFKVDGSNYGAEDTSSPYSLTWNSTGVSNGSHALTAVARDTAGNTTTAASVSVTVSNVVAPPPPPPTTGDPELPRVFLQTNIGSTPSNGAVINVPQGGDFQAALNSANPGDTIVLAAGAVYQAPVGGFVLPNKSNPNSLWITIRTSGIASLPEGTRVRPAQASFMPRIRSLNNNDAAIKTAPSASYYRLIGLEITSGANVTQAGGLISLGDGGSAQNSLSLVPHHLIVDRSYVHGTPTLNVQRCVAMNSGWSAVVDSYLSDCHYVGADAQAIGGWNGPGPYKIYNNYLEGSGENVMFGGSDPSIPNLISADIEVRKNYLYKPWSWKEGHPTYAGIRWSIKNSFELKNARRVLIDGNIFENSWTEGQQGWAILFTPRNQYGSAPWVVVQDVTFSNNIIRHAGTGFDLIGTDNNFPSGQLARLRVYNNVLEDITSALGGGHGTVHLRNSANVAFDHNTVFEQGNVFTMDSDAGLPKSSGFVYTNNISAPGSYGFFGSNVGEGTNALAAYFSSYTFSKNVLTGRNGTVYPASNFFPVALSEVGFVNYSGGNYRLVPSSPYKNAGTDGRDIGADIDAVAAATAGAITGTGVGNPPPPPPPATDAIPPTVSLSVPASGSKVSGVTTVSANASDNTGVAGVQFKLDGNNLGAEDTSSPYSINWNTTTASKGAHALTGTARDAAGNITTSLVVNVKVHNEPENHLATSVENVSQVLGTEAFNFTFLLKVGSKGLEVAELQEFLNGAGYDCGVVDGIFGLKTKAAVILFQQSKGLIPDGIFGPRSREASEKIR